MSSYGSAHSGQLHPGYQPQQQRARSYSNPPYPTTPGSAPFPQQQQTGYFPPPPTAPFQQAPTTSNPIAIPASNRKRASSDYGYTHPHGYGTSPSYPHPSSPYAHSFTTHHLQPIPQQQPIPENYQYPPQPHGVMPGSPDHHHRRRSSSSQYGYDPRQSYESTHSYQSAHSQPSPDYYAAQPVQNVHAGYGDYYGYGNESKHASGHAGTGRQEPPPPKGYGDWDKEEVSKYHKNQDLERRPTLGGSLLTLMGRLGGSRR